MKVQTVILLTIVQFSIFAFGQENYEKTIKFHVHKQGKETFKSNFCNNCTLKKECPPSENLTLIVTDPNYDFAQDLINAFHTARGGCVMWMDFSIYKPPGKLAYGELFAHYEGINAVLLRKLKQLEEIGYDLANLFVYGYSFGSYQAITAGYRLGSKKIGRIDACDPSSDTWIANTTPVAFQHAFDAAVNVQCIHTSKLSGTTKRFCPKSINMGKCGDQPYNPMELLVNWDGLAQELHDLCCKAYIASFTNDFKLVQKTQIESKYGQTCSTQQPVGTLPSSPTYTMGYRFDFSLPDGEYYADLTRSSPYYVA
ncbi:uncharacterized protein LOC134829116 [Culicoides brevitarsis]|uniref:uncharacterized protein LOC134829116 n=1 Tax=Culicoides brevitarsis TaxID=469753 RepID=UPI00307BE721